MVADMPLTWSYSLTVGEPSTEPVTIAEARDHCNLNHSDDDNKLRGWITAARKYCESYLDRLFVTTSVVLSASGFPEATNGNRRASIFLPKPPLISVASIVTTDADGNEETMSASLYTVSTPTKQQGKIHLAYGASWPIVQDVSGAVRVSYAAGYGEASAVPQTIKQAILMLTESMYSNREATEVAYDTVHRLLRTESWGSEF